MPEPMHMEMMPSLPLVLFSSGIRVAHIRAPVAPSGCPKAIAPPCRDPMFIKEMQMVFVAWTSIFKRPTDFSSYTHSCRCVLFLVDFFLSTSSDLRQICVKTEATATTKELRPTCFLLTSDAHAPSYINLDAIEN
eukprot:CAMPEP_0179002792 /NCGR_PEP_ID=MMETSP0795-20121207/12266_1 /TAXON_ID=88552 /ORGANISM="Amoebophrya sp., Strain Ameob2" /LENGTH=134 /DNA_ID=CAMNT_0020696623 /DNA_START=764 /DNA_END=1168 /DNA_ORIENTATION=+